MRGLDFGFVMLEPLREIGDIELARRVADILDRGTGALAPGRKKHARMRTGWPPASSGAPPRP